MKNQKGFIQVRLMAIIIAFVVVASASVGVVLYKQNKPSVLKAEIYTKVELFNNEEKDEVNYEEAIKDLQEQLALLQNSNQNQNGTDELQWQVTKLQQDLQKVQEEKEQSVQNIQETIQAESTKLDINQLVSKVAKVECAGGSGSGFLINSEGYIVTNYHVVKNPKYQKDGVVYNSLVSGSMIPGCIVSFTHSPGISPYIYYWASLPGIALDEENDLAILYIQSKLHSLDNMTPLNYSERNFSFIPKCSLNEFSVGDEITALGYPSLGLDTITITDGILSGIWGKYYKISAKLNPGNSGGPIIINNNKEGCYIGIVRLALGGEVESQPYAIKAELVPY